MQLIFSFQISQNLFCSFDQIMSFCNFINKSLFKFQSKSCIFDSHILKSFRKTPLLQFYSATFTIPEICPEHLIDNIIMVVKTFEIMSKLLSNFVFNKK